MSLMALLRHSEGIHITVAAVLSHTAPASCNVCGKGTRAPSQYLYDREHSVHAEKIAALRHENDYFRHANSTLRHEKYSFSHEYSNRLCKCATMVMKIEQCAMKKTKNNTRHVVEWVLTNFGGNSLSNQAAQTAIMSQLPQHPVCWVFTKIFIFPCP